MSPRASLPGAAELFRSTGSARPVSQRPSAAGSDAIETVAPSGPTESTPSTGSAVSPLPTTLSATTLTAVPAPPIGDVAPQSAPQDPPARRPAAVRQSSRRPRPVSERAPSGRERHEEKITVYCSAEELIDLESARLTLRAEHGMAVDRGRIVREALAVVLADLEAKGEASILVRRLREA